MTIEPRLTAVATMSTSDLRTAWHTSLGSEPPRISSDLLRRMLGHALQEKAMGGITAAQRQALRRIAAGKPDNSLKPGMRLVRHWNGRTIAVTVCDDGFLWEERTWRSLSAIAREVTGTAWSGPRFFGLRDHG
jgi:hypothetical protein